MSRKSEFTKPSYKDYSEVYWCKDMVYRHVTFDEKSRKMLRRKNININTKWRDENDFPMGSDWVHYGWFENAALFRRPLRGVEKELPVDFQSIKNNLK